MMKHIVMWKVGGSSHEERLQAALRVKEAFEGIRDKIPGLLHLEVGIDVSAVDYACDAVLYSEFVDAQALAAYANHPEHLRVRDELIGIRINRCQVDYPYDQIN